MDRHRVDPSGERLVELPDDRSGDVGRQVTMASPWSSGSPTNQHHRYLRGGVGEAGSEEDFSGGRFHPYRGQPDYPPTGSGYVGGPGFYGVQGLRDGPGGFGGQKMPMGGNKRGFEGIVESLDYGEENKFAKLFIGSVPRTATEEDIRPLFEEHGDVIEVALIRDKRTGQQQGCCFIKYATLEHAERAIRALHNMYTLPGGTGPIQVRYADGERERLGTVEVKLFVASLNKRATEKEVEEIFAPYGHVQDIYLMKDEMKNSRGCGFVKFSSRDMALAAMNALHGSYIMRGCDQPLIVRFADRKRQRPIDQRGAPAFGGPRFDAVIPNRQPSNFDERGGGHMPHNGWDSFSPPLQPAHVFGSQPAVKGGIAPTSASGSGSFGEGVAPTNGALPNLAPTSSSSQQSFTLSNAQVHPAIGQQMLPLQKSLIGSQNLPPSLPPHNPLLSSSNPQTQALQAPIQQLGQIQLPQSIGHNPFNQGLLAQQFPGLGGQLSASSSLILQNATAAAMQNPLGLQQHGLATVPSQQQLPSSNIPPQLVQQSLQHLPSQMLLQQQAQTLQSSYQSSQQAIFQIQQQLQMMQQSNVNQQQNSLVPKQQTQWAGQTQWNGPPPTSSASANTVATAIPSTIAATPSYPSSVAAGTVTLSCNWTEHTSPEGFKYYYNSSTRESKWEKPEDLTLFEQQQQQHKLFIVQQQQQQQQQQQIIPPQQRQSPSHTPFPASVQTMQQASQSQAQPQMQPRQQAQLHILQPSLAHPASGAAGHPTVQDLSYAQLHGASSVADSARAPQVAQGWAWKNQTGGS